LTQRIQDGPRPSGIILRLLIAGIVGLCGQAWINANQEPVVDIEENVKVLE
jgi:hypothetical protein